MEAEPSADEAERGGFGGDPLKPGGVGSGEDERQAVAVIGKLAEPAVGGSSIRLAVSESFVSLTEYCRDGAAALLDFDAEPLSWRRYADPHGGTSILKPDAYCRVRVGDFERGTFIEIDRATESPATITGKLRAYRQYWETGREQERRGYFPRVTFAVPDKDRRAVLRELCAAQPEESRPLWQVVIAGELTAALTGEVK